LRYALDWALKGAKFMRFLLAVLCAVLVSCADLALSTQQMGSPSRVTRAEALAMAEQYRSHQWMPQAANVLHGDDKEGIRVDTPDISYEEGIPGWWRAGVMATGVPYQWGGFSSLEEFDAGVKAGLAAGDVYTSAKRKMLDDAVSKHAVGVDCSGFISRCWKLPRSYSTRELPFLCQKIEWADLEPGDIVNTHNAHVLLFAGWVDGRKAKLTAYETGSPPTWKVLKHDLGVEWLKSMGYQPYRYYGIR
jgi:hypothetical protein